MKTLFGLLVGVWAGYYLATNEKHIWDVYRVTVQVSKK